MNAEEEEASAPLWLITCTDIMALMLTFFVMLYAMSITKDDQKWEAAKKSFIQSVSQKSAGYGGEQESPSLATVHIGRGLDVHYVRGVLEEKIKENKDLQGVVLNSRTQGLVISMPADLVFAPGSTRIGDKGERALYDITLLLSRLPNRLAIVGHTDPRPIDGGSNRTLSLERAASVAAFLRESGYEKPLTIHGSGSARFAELPEDIPAQEKLDLSRRVDIVITREHL